MFVCLIAYHKFEIDLILEPETKCHIHVYVLHAATQNATLQANYIGSTKNRHR